MILPPDLSPGHRIATTSEDLDQMVREMRGSDVRGVDFETSGLRYWAGQLPVGYSMGFWDRGPRAWYVPFDHRTWDVQADPDKAKAAFRDALQGATGIVGHNLKFDLKMARAGGWELPKDVPIHDTLIQASLIDEAQSFGLEKVVARLGCGPYGDPFAGKDVVTERIRDLARDRKLGIKGYLDRFGHSEIPVGIEGEYACRDIGHTLALDRAQ